MLLTRKVRDVGTMVRILPLAEGEVHGIWTLIERLGWELDAVELEGLRGIGLQRRRVWVVREATGPWLFDVIEGDDTLRRLGPEAVWATTGCSLDRWIAARAERICVGDPALVPDDAPAVDIRMVPLGTEEPDQSGRALPLVGGIEEQVLSASLRASR